MTTFRQALGQLNVTNANQAPDQWPPTFGGVVGWLVDLGYTDNLIAWGRAVDALRPAAVSVAPADYTPAGSPLTLSPRQMQEMQSAILSAFRPGDMETIALFGLGTSWEEIVAPGSYRDQVFQFIRWLVGNQHVEEFVRKAREENPGNELLKAFAESIGIRKYI